MKIYMLKDDPSLKEILEERKYLEKFAKQNAPGYMMANQQIESYLCSRISVLQNENEHLRNMLEFVRKQLEKLA